MKKLVVSLILLFSFWYQLASQSVGYTDTVGVFQWQYHRSVFKNGEDTTSAIVVFVFINGANTTAISYRQEAQNCSIEWLDSEKGEYGEDGFVQYHTAKLAPNEAILWRIKVNNNIPNNDNSIDVEKGALLILDKNYSVRKDKFPKQNIK
jgi:hypothetical protein